MDAPGSKHPGYRWPAALLILLLPVAVWSAIDPYEWSTWWLESLPVWIALPLLAMTVRQFPLTRLSYCGVWLHCIVLLIGAKYTYALVPAGDWLRDALDLSRNHYDRLGHLFQGFVPALIARELLLRLTPLRAGGWLFAIVALSILGVSAAYELLEWIAFLIAGSDADNFLGHQGDIWDAQKDMTCALIGAILAQLSFAHLQNLQIKTLRFPNS